MAAKGWIPACAGMTRAREAAARAKALDPRLRGDDGAGESEDDGAGESGDDGAGAGMTVRG